MNETPQKKSSGRSCFLYGCLSLIVVVVLLVVLGVVGVRYYVRSTIEQLTDSSPRQFEEAALPEAERQALDERIKAFAQDLQDTNKTAQISFDGRELNSVISAKPEFAAFKDQFRVQIEGDQLKGVVSIPLDFLAQYPMLGGLKGRFLNAEASVSVSLEDGQVVTQLGDVMVKSETLPPEAVAELQNKLPWNEIMSSPEVKQAIEKIDWLKIADGKLQIGTGKPSTP